MRNEEGERGSIHALSRQQLACTVAPHAPEQEHNTKPQSSSRVLRILAARSWVNPLCASPRSALRVTSAPAEPRKGLGPHRCSWRQISPDNLHISKQLSCFNLFLVFNT